MPKTKFLRQEKESRIARQQRLGGLITRIRLHDAKVNQKDLEDALHWGRRSSKSSQTASWNDRFSEPLELAETLVTLTKTDRDTALAAMLYAAVIREKEKGYDCEEHIRMIRERFGPRVAHIVEDTLSLWSLEHLSPSTQSPSDNMRDYKLMALLVGRSPTAILIRSAEAYLKICEFDTNTSYIKREEALMQAEIMADLCYLSRFSDVRRAILNETLRIRDPELYAKIRRHTSSVRRLNEEGDGILHQVGHDGTKKPATAKLTAEEIQNIEEQVANFLEKSGVLLRTDYKFELRVKDPHSIHEKTDRKKQGVEQLGDIYGGRIIINKSYVEEKFGKPSKDQSDGPCDVTIQSKKKRDPGQNASEILYWKLIWQCGRNAPSLKYLYDELAIRDPSSKDPTKDDRFDNYYKDVKESGYRAIQDTFFFIVNGKVVEVELQIVDEETHKNNTNGPPSHRLYKTNQTKNRHIIEMWEKCADQATEHGEQPRVPFAAVYDTEKDIRIVAGTTQEGCRAVDFIRQHFSHIQEQYPCVTSPDDIIGVRLENTNPLMKRDPKIPLSTLVNLRSGDWIRSFDVRTHLVPAG